MLKIFANWGKPRAFNQGWLQVSEIHKIFYQELGNPQGLPVICFHGGPGYWSRAETAKKFDLRKCRVILFDQRGCGKSQPLGEVKENTTHDLVDDAAKLLKHLGLKNKVVLFGSSWGTTLALLFAEKYPQLVEKLFLSKVFLADKVSREWEQRCSGWFYPDMMDEVRKPIKKEMKTAEFYYKEIMSGDLQKQLQAVNLYGSYENVLGSLQPQLGRGEVTEVEVMSCRVMMHYAANNLFGYGVSAGGCLSIEAGAPCGGAAYCAGLWAWEQAVEQGRGEMFASVGNLTLFAVLRYSQIHSFVVKKS